jgi:putative CocE/NonD family hydrolase
MEKFMRFLLHVPLLFIIIAFACAQPADELRQDDYFITMRDGTKLFTKVIYPTEMSANHPILLCRTPYNVKTYSKRYINYWRHFTDQGYILVFQDVRGKYRSEGTFIDVRPYIHNKSGTEFDESSDTYDTIDWLLKYVEGHNDRVGMLGISYPGFYAAMGAVDAHPALKAVSPQAPIADWFIGDDFHHNGAFTLNLAFNFFSTFGLPRSRPTAEPPRRFKHGTPDGYQFFLDMGALPNANKLYFNSNIQFWNEMMAHGSYDNFWKQRSTLHIFEDIKPAVMTVGGWFDAEDCFGALQTYLRIEEKNPDQYNILIMGPWAHGAWLRSKGDYLGKVAFGSTTGRFYIENIELPFFNSILKKIEQPELPEATVFATGDNQWYTFSHWPPQNLKTRRLYLTAGAGIVFDKPPGGNSMDFVEYLSDPAKPVPYTAQITTRIQKSYMVEDQRFASQRPDVLTFRSGALEEDVTIAGPLVANLYVSTTGTDADWVVKIIDVFPNSTEDNEYPPVELPMRGYQMLVRGDIIRGKFRNSLEIPEPFIPNQATRVRFTMNDILHTFKEGHEIMVQIQSSWFPLFDRNPQIFTDIYKAGDDLFKKATHQIYVNEKYPSHIEFGTLNLQAVE